MKLKHGNRYNYFLTVLLGLVMMLSGSALHAADEAVSIQADVNPAKGTVGTSFDYTVTLSG